MLASVIIFLGLALVVVLAVRSIVRDKKSGKGCGGCSGNCGACHTNCHGE